MKIEHEQKEYRPIKIILETEKELALMIGLVRNISAQDLKGYSRIYTAKDISTEDTMQFLNTLISKLYDERTY